MIGREIDDGLRVVYYSPADTKDAGFTETDHFGPRFPVSRSTFDLTGVPQRWLRDLLWEHLAEQLRSERAPRSRGPFDSLRRGCVELGAYLEVNAPQGGHVPALLDAQHAQGFAADQRYRERHGLTSRQWCEMTASRRSLRPSLAESCSTPFVKCSTGLSSPGGPQKSG